MKKPKEAYVGAGVFFERLADDGWPEDAGWWPIGGCTSPLVSAPTSASRESQPAFSLSVHQILIVEPAIQRSCRRLAVTRR
jgi:hypothetical protein